MATKKTKTKKDGDKEAPGASGNDVGRAASPSRPKRAPKSSGEERKARPAKKKAVVVEEEEDTARFAPYVTPPTEPPAPEAPPPPPPPPEPVVEEAQVVEPPEPAPAPPVTEQPPRKGVAAVPPRRSKVAPTVFRPTQKPTKAQPFSPSRPHSARPTRPSHKTAVSRTHAESRHYPGPVAEKADEKIEGKRRKSVRFNEMMTVGDLAKEMDVKVPDVIRKLLTLGKPATINQRLEADVATLVADAFDCDVAFRSIYDEKSAEVEPEGALKPRPPVVTVMGHVDHGKTSLLDAIREASVVSGEVGGITQHIGAYQVKTDKGLITFLDTPGHEAFTAMRARGAQVTDIVILVVAADDGVKPQTVEAIDHAKAANLPVVVAINKIDLPAANAQRVKQELTQYNLQAEDWGGKTVMVEVSARNKLNIEKLLEMVMLEAELLELKANPDRSPKGVVLEARVDPRRGVTATILIQAGTLRVGEVVVCGLTFGRVRAMVDEKRNVVEAAGPSKPVEVLGLSQVPQVGDQLSVVATDREAREIVERRKLVMKGPGQRAGSRLTLESLHAQIEEGNLQELKVILKTDVQGSMQAIQDMLGKIIHQAIQIRFVHAGIGNVNESDVLLAEASDAIVFGFSVKVEAAAEALAKRDGVEVRTYRIIYEMLADIRAAMEGLLKPVEREVTMGRAVIKSVFSSSRLGTVAGVMVQEGKINRGAKARLVRGEEVVATASLSSLRRFKDDVREVEKGYECGLSLEGVRDYQPGDLVETFIIEKDAQRLDS